MSKAREWADARTESINRTPPRPCFPGLAFAAYVTDAGECELRGDGESQRMILAPSRAIEFARWVLATFE